MKIHQLKFTQTLPISLDEAWLFFSSPKNLNELTPEDMSFQILSGAEEKAYAGQIITYRIRPVMDIPMNWVTEITHCIERRYFIDVQRFGPYKFWHHQHHFKEIEGGVAMTDILHYALPFGWIGQLAGWLFIHRKVRNIFEYRTQKLNSLFAKKCPYVANSEQESMKKKYSLT